MKHRGKLFGAAIGFTLGGPIGALLGGTLGAAVDSADQDGRERFTLALARYLAGVAGSDGPVNPPEVLAIRTFFLGQVQPSSGAAPGPARAALRGYALDRLIHRAMSDPAPLERTAQVVNPGTDYEQRLFLLHLGYQVAVADGPLNREEDCFLGRAAELFSLHGYDRVFIRSRFAGYPGSGRPAGGGESAGRGMRDPRGLQDPYAVLGVSPGCSHEELHRAYRARAGAYHPDRVSHLGLEFVDLATEKFNHIQEAYQRIKKSRGLP